MNRKHVYSRYMALSSSTSKVITFLYKYSYLREKNATGGNIIFALLNDGLMKSLLESSI